MAFAAVVSFVATTNSTTVIVYANPPKTAVQENLRSTDGRRMAIKKTAIKEYENYREKGIIGVKIDENDQLLSAAITDGSRERS